MPCMVQGASSTVVDSECRQGYLCDLSIGRYKHITCTQVALLVLATLIRAAIVFAFASCPVSGGFAIFGSSLFDWTPG